MMRIAACLVLASCIAAAGVSRAQESRSPGPEPEPEPAVDTSAMPDAPAPPDDAAPAPASASGDTPAARPAQERATSRSGRVMDRIELDTTQITGNRELPKVLYIVPWKRSDLGDLVGKPVNSLLDEVLAPVDRDVFKRENRYYRALQPDPSPNPLPAERGEGAEGG
ncbi:MAG: hypothetical protein ACT4O5_12945 [Gammaproteobacteria bacterium]